MLNVSASDILDFKPKAFNRTIDTDINIEKEYTKKENVTNNEMYKVKPSIILQKINNINNNIYYDKIKIEKAIKSIDFENLRNVHINNLDYSNVIKYLDFNCNDIKGDINVELYDTLCRYDKEANDLKKSINIIFYGNANIPQTKCESIDNQYLIDYEYNKQNNINTINCFAMNCDTKANILLTSYVNAINACIECLTNLIDDKISTVKLNNVFQNKTYNTFNDLASKNAYCRLRHNKYIDTNVIQYNLLEIFKNRKIVLEASKMYNDILKIEDYKVMIKFINDYHKKINNLNDSLVEFYKAIMTSVQNKNDYIESLQDKNQFRNIYNKNFKNKKEDFK